MLSGAYQTRWHLKVTHSVSQTSDGLYLAAFYWERVPCGVFGNAQFAQALARKKVLGGHLPAPRQPEMLAAWPQTLRLVQLIFQLNLNGWIEKKEWALRVPEVPSFEKTYLNDENVSTSSWHREKKPQLSLSLQNRD